jgi:hypothetical protein
LLDAGIQRFGLIYGPVENQFDVSSRNASNIKAYSLDLATIDGVLLAEEKFSPKLESQSDLLIFADLLIFRLRVIRVIIKGNNQILSIFADWDPGPAEKNLRGPKIR